MAKKNKKNRNKMNQARRQRRAAKQQKRAKAVKFEKAIDRVMKEHNKIRWRELPMRRGKYPYQLAPIDRAQAKELLLTGHYTPRGRKMSVVPMVRKGGDITMTEERTAKKAELNAKTDRTAAQSALLEALTALEASEQAVVLAEQEVAKEAEAEVAKPAEPTAPAGETTPADAGAEAPATPGEEPKA